MTLMQLYMGTEIPPMHEKYKLQGSKNGKGPHTSVGKANIHVACVFSEKG